MRFYENAVALIFLVLFNKLKSVICGQSAKIFPGSEFIDEKSLSTVLKPHDKTTIAELTERVPPQFNANATPKYAIIRPNRNSLVSRPKDLFSNFPNANTLKIFGVGLSRTSTSSLAKHLALLGLRVVHYDGQLTAFLNSSIPFQWKGIYDEVDAVFDLPTAFYYKELMEVYPQALFIATHRDPAAWFANFEKYLQIIVKSLYLGVMPFTMRSLHETVYGSARPEKDLWISRFIKHYDDAAKAIPKHKLLHISVESIDGRKTASEICRFIGFDVNRACPLYPSVNTMSEIARENDPSISVSKHFFQSTVMSMANVTDGSLSSGSFHCNAS